MYHTRQIGEIVPVKILGVIPARGGSKGVKEKNIKTLFDKPLIAYSIESALKSNFSDA